MTTSKKYIPVAEPALVGNEKQYVLDCIESNWISSAGEYVDLFEGGFAKFCSTKHAIACSSGTVALHLALLALDVGPGDEVIVPSMTFIATANAVVYCGATPVFADSSSRSWNIDPIHVETLITAKTKAIIAVHLFGLPADMDALREIANINGIAIVEDAAEAHGARYGNQTVGGLGDIAVFSFYGNKILTTGEGGMVTTDDDKLAARVRLLKGQGLSPDRRYWHTVIGYNYRMTNIAAAIGLAQLERASWHITRRKEIAETYRKLLSGEPRVEFQEESGDSTHVYWMTSITLLDVDIQVRDEVMAYMLAKGVETRPFFVPMHVLPIYKNTGCVALPVAVRLGNTGISLPSGALLTRQDQERVVLTLLEALEVVVT